MKLTLLAFDLRLRHPFTISRGTTTVRPTLVVELEQDGQHGYGEAAEYPYYGAGRDTVRATLEQVRAQIESMTLSDPVDFWETMCPLLYGDVPRGTPTPATFPQCALDVAAHDLWGKLQGRPVWQLWGLDLETIPPSDYTIGIDAIDVMVKKLEECLGFPAYKIKLGTPDDVQIVRRLREHSDAVFRIDANGAWSVQEAIHNAAAMQDLGVEFIEQPLPAGDWEGMKHVYRESVLPCMADESCQAESDVERCAGHFHGINIKLEKCGGLTPARRMIARAGQMGLRVMAGCFVQSTVGISGIAQLLPLLDYADLDGALLLAEDIATGVTLDQGRVRYPEVPGCGTRLLPYPSDADHPPDTQ